MKITTTLLTLGCLVISPCAAASSSSLSDLQKIDDGFKTCGNTCANANPLTGTCSLCLMQLDATIKNPGVSDANNSPPGSDSDYRPLVNYMNSPLEPDVKATMNVLISVETQYQQAGTAVTIHNDLVQIKSDLTTLFTAFVAKSPSDLKSSFQTAANKIEADIQTAIDAYSS